MSPPSSCECTRRTAPTAHAAATVSVSSASSGSFAERRTDLHAMQERRPQAAEHAQPRHRHVLAERIGDEIDLVPERGERPDAVKFAERRAARLEERLGRDHQNAHGSSDFLTKP